MAKVTIKKDACKGCQLCIGVCPKHHLTLSKTLNKRGVRYVEVALGAECSGCGFCFAMCPDVCIEINLDARPGKK
ncbi:MAG: ferredoxin family protein [Candidatus Omnitrophota bacterium]|nr:ferredoxin family protein [Candidatus Omnitrophota bacterium]